MSETLLDIANLFVSYPGNLIYFMVVILVSLGSALMAFEMRQQQPDNRRGTRYVLALLGIAGAWLLMALLVGSVSAAETDVAPGDLLPPLERFAGVVLIILLAWAVTPMLDLQGRQRANRFIGVTLVLAVIGYVATLLWWDNVAGQTAFDLTTAGTAWLAVGAVLSGLLMLYMLIRLRRIPDAPLKAVFFGVLLLGHGGTLLAIAMDDGITDYAGLTRLAIFIGMLLVPVISYRAITGILMEQIDAVRGELVSQRAPAEPSQPSQTMSPVERESVQLMRVLGLILEEATPSAMPRQVLNAVIDVLKTDVAVLLRLKDANYLDMDAGYDRFLQREISGMAINLDNQPTLVSSVQRRTQRELLPGENDDELNDLFVRFDIEQIGPVYFQPLTRNQSVVAVLIAAMPYSKRELMRSEKELLKGIAVMAASLLELSYAASESQVIAEERAIQAMVNRVTPGEVGDEAVISAREEMRASLELARDQITKLSQQVVDLKTELDRERSRVADDLGDAEETLSSSQRLVALNEEQKKLRDERDRLAARLQEAEAALHSTYDASDETLYQNMVESLQRERDDLAAQRDSLQAELEALRGSSGALMAPQDVDAMITRMEDEKTRLQDERDQMQRKLTDIQQHLDAAGVEAGPSGLAQLLNRLAEQRAVLQSENEALRTELERMASQEVDGDDQGQSTEAERVQRLETTVKNLAEDREVAIKQRDDLRAEFADVKEKLRVLKERWKRLESRAQAAYDALESTRAEKERLAERVNALVNERDELSNERDRLAAEKEALETERDQLAANAQGDGERLEDLNQGRFSSLTAMIDDLTTQRQQLQKELNSTRQRLETVEGELAEARVQSDGLQEDEVVYRPDNPDLMMGLVQDLRTPMTSITGYVDLLLGESAGILGEMQRKFLSRVYTNVMRLDSMLDDLIRITELDTGNYSLSPVPVDVVSVIEDAITYSASQFREKGLTVNLKLDADLPPAHLDRDAVNQIIGQLLTNAYLISPPDSEVGVYAEHQQAELGGGTCDCVYIAVQDQGGGISPEDEPRVFARKYKAENPLIQGLGDTGVGLSIAKALVEAQGGKLWLTTEEGVGSAFKMLLPLHGTAVQQGVTHAS